MIKFAMEAPWFTYQKKVKALFERDPDITVGGIYEPEDGTADFGFDIEVKNHEKYLALDRALVKQRTFGNVPLSITLFDEENVNDAEDYAALFETVFRGNPILSDVKRAIDFAGTQLGFVLFRPEVIQFPDDDTSDFYGNWNGLAEDIAREVFLEGYRGVSFCTELVDAADGDACQGTEA